MIPFWACCHVAMFYFFSEPEAISMVLSRFREDTFFVLDKNFPAAQQNGMGEDPG